MEYQQRLRRKRRGVLADRREPHVGTRLWREAALHGSRAIGPTRRLHPGGPACGLGGARCNSSEHGGRGAGYRPRSPAVRRRRCRHSRRHGGRTMGGEGRTSRGGTAVAVRRSRVSWQTSTAPCRLPDEIVRHRKPFVTRFRGGGCPHPRRPCAAAPWAITARSSRSRMRSAMSRGTRSYRPACSTMATSPRVRRARVAASIPMRRTLLPSTKL